MSLFNQMAELNRPQTEDYTKRLLKLSLRKESLEKSIDTCQLLLKIYQDDLEAIRKEAEQIQKDIDQENQMFV